jgi:hypothetical protein
LGGEVAWECRVRASQVHCAGFVAVDKTQLSVVRRPCGAVVRRGVALWHRVPSKIGDVVQGLQRSKKLPYTRSCVTALAFYPFPAALARRYAYH